MLQTTNNVNCLYMTDITGNPIPLSTSFNTTAYPQHYDPYGAATQTGGPNGATEANRYTYAGGDPINRADPTGLFSFCELSKGALVFGGVSCRRDWVRGGCCRM